MSCFNEFENQQDALSSVGAAAEPVQEAVLQAAGFFFAVGYLLVDLQTPVSELAEKAIQICRDLVDIATHVEITADEVRVEFHRRSQWPVVLACGR